MFVMIIILFIVISLLFFLLFREERRKTNYMDLHVENILHEIQDYKNSDEHKEFEYHLNKVIIELRNNKQEE